MTHSIQADLTQLRGYSDLERALVGVRCGALELKIEEPVKAASRRLSCYYELMSRTSLAEWPCSVARVMDLFGDPWTPLIMREAYLEVRRFDVFQRNLGVARNTLSDRLNKLVDNGLLTKRLYQDNPPRNEYLLTDMGRDFFPVLSALMAWGDRWLDGGHGAPMTLHHTLCGHDLGLAVVCDDCGERVQDTDVEFRIGPGYPGKVEAYLDMRPRLAQRAKSGAPAAGKQIPAAPKSPAAARTRKPARVRKAKAS